MRLSYDYDLKHETPKRKLNNGILNEHIIRYEFAAPLGT